MNMDDFMNDIPLDLARLAHEFTSHVPEERAVQERESYASTLAQDYQNLVTYANTPEKLAILAEEFDRYRAGYRRRYTLYLGARSRCASTLVTGGSNFPVRRQQKANDRTDKLSAELQEFRLKAFAAIKRKLTPEDQPVMAGDSDAIERLRMKLAEREADHARMKAGNMAIRKHAKAGREAQLAALIALGFSKALSEERLTPDFARRIGWSDYELKNNGAEIRRLKARIEAISAAVSQPDTTNEGTWARVEDCPAENRVRVFFPGKPAMDVIARLKSHGFRWTPSLGCWQAYRNPRSIDYARVEAGIGGQA